MDSGAIFKGESPVFLRNLIYACPLDRNTHSKQWFELQQATPCEDILF